MHVKPLPRHLHSHKTMFNPRLRMNSPEEQWICVWAVYNDGSGQYCYSVRSSFSRAKLI